MKKNENKEKLENNFEITYFKCKTIFTSLKKFLICKKIKTTKHFCLVV